MLQLFYSPYEQNDSSFYSGPGHRHAMDRFFNYFQTNYMPHTKMYTIYIQRYRLHYGPGFILNFFYIFLKVVGNESLILVDIESIVREIPYTEI